MKSAIYLFSFGKILCRSRDEIVHFSYIALGLEDPWDYWHGLESCWLTTDSNEMCSGCSLSLGGDGNAMMGNKHATVAFKNKKTPQFVEGWLESLSKSHRMRWVSFLWVRCVQCLGGGRLSYCKCRTVMQEGVKWGSWYIFDSLLSQSSDLTFFPLKYIFCHYPFWNPNSDLARHP